VPIPSLRLFHCGYITAAIAVCAATIAHFYTVVDDTILETHTHICVVVIHPTPDIRHTSYYFTDVSGTLRVDHNCSLLCALTLDRYYWGTVVILQNDLYSTGASFTRRLFFPVPLPLCSALALFLCLARCSSSWVRDDTMLCICCKATEVQCVRMCSVLPVPSLYSVVLTEYCQYSGERCMVRVVCNIKLGTICYMLLQSVY
jgi:hypothetical protein